MGWAEFKLERYFARYEFAVPYQLGSSDAESYRVEELLALESGAERVLAQLGLGYTEAAGSRQLRETLAGLYAHCTADDLLVHAGAQEAIFTFTQALLQPGDHVIVQSPCYQSLMELPRGRGCQVTPWHMEEEGGAWQLGLDRLAASIQSNTRCIIINTPHNPTGYTWSGAELDQLLSLARDHQLWVLADEVYRYSEHDPAIRQPWVADSYEKAVSLGVMSKSFGLAGLRIGWAAGQDRALLARMAAIKDYTSICASAPAEFLAILALRHRHGLLQRNLGIIHHNLQHADAFFAEFPQLFAWERPRAGTIAFPRLRAGAADAYCRRLRVEAGVLVLPASLYDWGQHHFRLGFGRKDFPQGLERWADFCRAAL